MRAYSDQEIIAGTYRSEVDNSSRGFGTSNNTGSSGIQATLLAAQFRGANAEWTEAEMRAVMHGYCRLAAPFRGDVAVTRFSGLCGRGGCYDLVG